LPGFGIGMTVAECHREGKSPVVQTLFNNVNRLTMRQVGGVSRSDSGSRLGQLQCRKLFI